MEKRTYNEILKEAAETSCLKAVIDCTLEMKKDKRSYTVAQWNFAIEFFCEQGKRIARKDARRFKRIIETD